MRNKTAGFAAAAPRRTMLSHAMIVALGASLLAFAPVAAAQQQEAREFSLASQPLGDALNRLAQAADVQILVPPDLVRGRTAPALTGKYTVGQALDRLLAGSGLTHRSTRSGVITVSRAEEPPRPASPPPPPPPAAQSSGNIAVLENVVVTADRPSSFGADVAQVGTFRNARLLDVPMTINVVPKELFEAQAATSMYDGLRNTAGVSRSESNGTYFDNIVIRGIQVENRVNYKLNGTLAVVNLASIPVENKERIEVLKGVGALYYGFAPPSGIINFVTKRGDRDVTQLVASVNEYGGADMAVDFGRRVSDRFGVRVNAVAGKRDPGIDDYRGERRFASLATDWEPIDDLKIFFDAEYVGLEASKTGVILLPAAVDGVVALPPLPPNTINYGGNSLRIDSGQTNLQLRANWRLSEQGELTFEVGQSEMSRDRMFGRMENYSLQAGPNYGEGRLRVTRTKDQKYRNRYGRVEYASAFSTGAITHNLSIGSSLNERWQNSRAGTVVNVPQNYFNPRPITVDEPTTFTEAPNFQDDMGAYVFDRASIGRFDVLAGARWNNYHSKTSTTAGVITRYAVKSWSPSAGLVFKPTETLSFYGTYIEGLEEVAPAPNTSANFGDVLEPAVSEQYEVGMKSEMASGVMLQVAGFRINRSSAFVDPADNIYKMAGQSRYQGIEASLTGELTRELSIYLTAQYLDAVIRNSAQAALIGKTPENTPERTLSAYLQYRPSSIPGLSIGGGAFHVGERPVNSLNQGMVPGHTLLSASVGYTFENVAKGLTLQLTGDNLANKDYWAGAGGNSVTIGAPRTVKLTARVRF